MTIADIVSKFNTTPFLFVGSGITRRYFSLPDWSGLLKHFADIVGQDEFAYSFYENKAKSMECKAGILPKVAELIQKDYDDKWFSDSSIRTLSKDSLQMVQNGLSPFKAEIANYILDKSVINPVYQEEVEFLAQIAEKSISGVITTNYDTFLETYLSGFVRYIGQNQLVFSAIQGIAEIYKIHGSVDVPSSIIINEQDYIKFDKNINDNDIEIIIDKLIDTKYLDDDNFCKCFIMDKLKFTNTGEYKIISELKRNEISSDIIDKYYYLIDNDVMNDNIYYTNHVENMIVQNGNIVHNTHYICGRCQDITHSHITSDYQNSTDDNGTDICNLLDGVKGQVKS